MLGLLLGPEDTEMNIEIALILQSFQGSRGSGHKRLYVKGTERVEVIPWVLGRHWAPCASRVGFGQMNRRFTEVRVGWLCPGGHFSSGKTGESVCKGTDSLGGPWNLSVWLVCGVTVGQLGLNLEYEFQQQ